jgi:hypothetical protein
VGVPGVGRLEGDLRGLQAEAVERVLIDPWIGLEDAHGVDRKHRVEQRAQASARDRLLQHAWRTVGKNRGRKARPTQGAEHAGNFGEWRQGAIEAHQAVAQSRRGYAETVEREIQRVAGDLPEVGVTALQRTQPRVLQLLVAPQRGQRRAPARLDLGAGRGRRGEVEQRAVGVENAGANAFETAHPKSSVS